MKFLCVDCDVQIEAVDQAAPGDGTLAVTFRCPKCKREIAMLANPMETQLVSSLCVKVGGRNAPEQPFEAIRSQLETGGRAALQNVLANASSPGWSSEAEERLARVPPLVQGMIRRLYGEWARQRGIVEITPELMDEARLELGL
jgi:hypothetical protein